MDKLFSPWRSKYIETFSQPQHPGTECVLCNASQDDKDDEHLIVSRAKRCFVIMNLFPYNSGHLLIVPYRHVPSIIDLAEDELTEVMSLIQRMMQALQKVSHPDGFNIGANVGRTAGAGIDQHIHFHIVPRWNGDTNFMPVLSDTRVISEHLRATYGKLKGALEEMNAGKG